MPHYFKPSVKHRWIPLLIYGVGLWIASVALAVFSMSGAIRSLAIGGHMTVGIGPLQLIDFYKGKMLGGYTLILHFRLGLVFLALLYFSLEAIVFWCIRHNHQKAA
jgi:hypothetical protein